MAYSIALARPCRSGAGSRAGATLAAAVLGFFVVTLDAVVINVALPSIRRDLGGGISGLQWVVDGYTLMFAALLLSSGALSDRIGARRSFGAGVGVFVLASAACSAVVAVGALVTFVLTEARTAHPMVPAELFRSRNVTIANAVGFAFIVGYFGLPFVMSLYLQQVRNLSPLSTGLTFLAMMLIGALLTPLSARVAERLGARLLIATGLALMTAGLVILAVLPASSPVWVVAAVMVLVGLAGPLTMPPTAVLLNSVPAHHAGTASGVFNTCRQLGGALAVAVFGALLAQPASFLSGLRASLLIAAVIVALATGMSGLLRPPPTAIHPERQSL